MKNKIFAEKAVFCSSYQFILQETRLFYLQIGTNVRRKFVARHFSCFKINEN